MNKALYLAADLALAPLPVLAQQGQAGAGAAQTPQSQAAQGGHSTNGGQSFNAQSGGGFDEREAYEEESPSTRGDLLDRLAHSDLRDRIAAGIERVEDACGP